MTQSLLQGHLVGTLCVCSCLQPDVVYPGVLALLSFSTVCLFALFVPTGRHSYSQRLSFGATAFLFGLASTYALSRVASGPGSETGLWVFLVSNVVYHYGEFQFVNYCHHPTLSWNCKYPS